MRAPLRAWEPLDPTPGPYTGVAPVNLPMDAVSLVIGPDGTFHPEALEWLRTRASADDVADALELLDVHRSHHAAGMRNAKLAAKRER